MFQHIPHEYFVGVVIRPWPREFLEVALDIAAKQVGVDVAFTQVFSAAEVQPSVWSLEAFRVGAFCLFVKVFGFHKSLVAGASAPAKGCSFGADGAGVKAASVSLQN